MNRRAKCLQPVDRDPLSAQHDHFLFHSDLSALRLAPIKGTSRSFEYGEEEQPPSQENPCNLVDCIPNTRCIVVKGEAKCIPVDGYKEPDCETPKPKPSCATVLCKPPTTCVIRPVDPRCADDCDVEAVCVNPVPTQQAAAPKKTYPSTPQTCPPNEQYNTCGTACEPSCSVPTPEICTLQCVVGCQCKPGFYRNYQKVCVSNCNGKEGDGCGDNEESKRCGTACEPTCSNPNPVCTKQCVVNVCQCKSGFIRDAKNKCIPVDNCPKGNGNETPKPKPSCATVLCKPPTTCVIRPVDPRCADDCDVEAVCVNPVPTQQAVAPKKTYPSTPQTCPPNEQYNTCGTACEPSCSVPTPEICTLQCVVGCQCKPGFYRNYQKVCVSNCNGKEGAGCGDNEESKRCGTACEPTCSNPNPVCTKQCVVNVCQCKNGFIRDAENKCIPVDNCPKDRIKLCSEMNCPPGTVCELGRVICPFVPPCFTRPTQCGPSATGESSITCANVRCRGGTVCKMVDVVCKKAPCPQRPQCVPDEPFNPCAATTCPVGSECRVKQVQCIRAPCNPIAECYTPPQSGQCGKFETYRSCASHCEPSCTNKSPICILSCAPPKCQCTQGFFRNASGECVTEAECDGNSDTNPYSR
ncbi:hypothetical protein RB195_014915 [Necator americanus]|uniref:Follistatin-like domain-containing protein n=1 Tax=Necator americanus TaxID=51031 RepID=A0ABR1E2N1_NECAM